VNRFARYIAVLAATGLLAAACGGGATTASPTPVATASATPTRTYTITQGFVTGLNHLPDELAPQYGSQFGVEIKTVYFNNVPDTVTAMGRGDIDLMINTPSTVLSGLDRGLELVMIAGGYYRSTQIITSSKLGVNEGDWAKLKSAVDSGVSAGKKLRLGAAASLSANWVECFYSMKQHGIDVTASLTVVNIPAFSEHPGAMQRGDVDLLCSPEPFGTLALAAGGTFFAFPFDTPAGETLGGLVVTKAALANADKKEAIKRYIQSYDFAVKKVNSDKAFAVQNAMTIMKTNDQALATRALANTKFFTGFNLTEVQALAKMHFEQGQTNKDWSLDPKVWTDDQFVKDLK
jgi:ABC-type nitrate/sulfonate/bicarbonate transport system substrate-binding protein